MKKELMKVINILEPEIDDIVSTSDFYTINDYEDFNVNQYDFTFIERKRYG